MRCQRRARIASMQRIRAEKIAAQASECEPSFP
jgi:hypothetical protein